MDQASKQGAVVITGASSGIGEACAVRLAGKGFHVFAGVRREADGDLLKRKTSGALTPLLLDVTNSNSIAIAQGIVSEKMQGQGIAGLVNNAGIPLGGPIEFMSLDEMRKEIEVNIIGGVAMIQAFLPLLREGKGRIVNMGSISGLIAFPFLGPYAATKFAMEAISDSLRQELRPWGIGVSVIEPGNVATPLWDKSRVVIDTMAKEWSQKAIDLYGPVLNLGRDLKPHGISPEKVAQVVEHALITRHVKPH
jgi:NAD(P)-dependent dehydrogenase (short-subunit alcohol dehydrogenase family)